MSDGNFVDTKMETVFTQDMTTTTDRILDLVDAIAPHLTDTPQSPSCLARKARITTYEAHDALRWMVENSYAVPVGNGAWTTYRERRFGERP